MDEALYGMAVDVLDAAHGFCRVRTRYRYEGYLREGCLFFGDTAAWEGKKKRVVSSPYLDVQAEPSIVAACVGSLPRGGLLAASSTGEGPEGWTAVGLADGRAGYCRSSGLMDARPHWSQLPQAQVREAIVETALSYLGAQYRWGGKTPLGIDCSGLCSIAYLINGALIYRDATLMDGFEVHGIGTGQLGKGDLLFYPGHVAMYIGDGAYVHSSARAGSVGVMVNSLDKASPLYLPDLDISLALAGSLF
jgi:hypothetical protein